MLISTHTPLAGRDQDRKCFGRDTDDFYSHAPCGARQTGESGRSSWSLFLLTRPLRGATGHVVTPPRYFDISTHTPLAGRDVCFRVRSGSAEFLLTRPLRGATETAEIRKFAGYFYSHAPCGARQNGNTKMAGDLAISTHTPLAGRDGFGFGNQAAVEDFYSHAPCGARLNSKVIEPPAGHFYSHAPCGARRKLQVAECGDENFYSHAPCGARRFRIRESGRSRRFLLTRPLRGATCNRRRRCICKKFLLTRPLRGATGSLRCPCGRLMISTHTPLAGRDICVIFDIPLNTDFYSHAPCGARPETRRVSRSKKYFYSHAPCGARPEFFKTARRLREFLLTRPLRGATPSPRAHRVSQRISTHTPLAGRDDYFTSALPSPQNFYSHAPCGARP